jgi:hypothetical protein
MHPRHRGDCADFFVTEKQPARIQLDGPRSVIGELERASAKAGRTWNDQLTYVFEICFGYHLPDFEDGRTAEDWRTLMSQLNFRFSEGESWSSFAAMRRMTP